MKELEFTHGRKLGQYEMKKIKGAEDAAQSTFTEASNCPCTITTYGKDGRIRDSYTLPDCNSSAANQHCVDLIVTAGTGVYRCTYTCAYAG